MEKGDVQATVEAFMRAVRNNLESGENVYLRGFGSFVVKTRAAKTEATFWPRSPFRFQLTTFLLLSQARISLRMSS